MKKGLLKRFSALFLTLVVMFTFMAESTVVFAEELTTTKNTEKYLYNFGYTFSSSSGLPNGYDPIKDSPNETSASTYSDTHYNTYNYNRDFPYYVDSDGKYCYCVQVGTKHVDSVTMEELDLQEKASAYFNASQIRDLRRATIYTYKGKTKYGYTWEQELVASQVIVWAISAR